MPQLNGQLNPAEAVRVRRKRVGVADLSDFDTYNQPGSNFASGWNDIQTQITGENTSLQQQAQQFGQNAVTSVVDTAGNVVPGLTVPGDSVLTGQLTDQLNGAKTAFTNAYEQITSQGLTAITSNPVAAAKQFVLAGNSIAGAVQTVLGLASNLSSEAKVIKVATTVLSSFTGVMVALLVGVTGAITAGVGAIIVGLVATAVAFLNSLFAKAPQPTANQVQICTSPVSVLADKTYAGLPIAFTIGCVPVYTSNPQIGPGSTAWRSFPDPNNPADAAWFRPIYLYGGGPGLWNDADFWAVAIGTPAEMGRPIDVAFPNYRYLECEMYDIDPGSESFAQSAIFNGTNSTDTTANTYVVPSNYTPPKYTPKTTVTDFQKAFFAAWKANSEYALNGLVPQTDPIVLLHLIRIWNAAHWQGQVVVFQQTTLPTASVYPSPCVPSPMYAESLVQNVPLSNTDPYFAPPQGAALAGGATQAIFVHGGDIRSVPVTTNLQPLTNPPSTTVQTVATAAGATAVAAVVGTVAYSYVTGTALSTVYKGLWSAVKRVFVR